MLQKLQPYSWFALVISLLAAIFSGGYFYVQREFDLSVMIGIGLCIIGLALYTLINPDSIRKLFTGRQIRYASNAVIYIIALAAVLVALNTVVNKQDKNWDFSFDQLNTLSTTTVEILHNLPGKVEALAFFSTQFPKDDAETLLKNLAENSQGNLSYRFIDPNADTVTVKAYNLSADGSIIFVLNGFQQDVKLVTENEVAAALVRLSNPESPVVYFLTGHGERDPFGTGNQSYSSLRSALEKKNYVIKSLNLLADPRTPEDAAAIIISGPQKPISINEVELLKPFLNSGGALVVFEDSKAITEFGSDPDPLAEYLKADWGLSLNEDFVVDMNSEPASQIVASQYGNHLITTRMAGIASIFPSTRSITLQEPAPAGLILTALVFSSENSWGETDLDGLKLDQLKFDQDSDLPGPLALGAVAENIQSGAKLVSMGSAYFAMDENFDVYGNGDLAINIIDWATENEELIDLTMREPARRLLITPSQTMLSLLFLVTVILIPGSIITTGFVVWINRRKRN